MACRQTSAMKFVNQLVEVGNFLSHYFRDQHPLQAITQVSLPSSIQSMFYQWGSRLSIQDNIRIGGKNLRMN